MASGNNPNNNNNNSLQPHNPLLFTPQQYLANRQWILQQASHYEEINKRGVENYLQVQRELQRKAQEGEQARKQLEFLERLTSSRQIAAPVPFQQNRGPTYMTNSQSQASSGPAAQGSNPSSAFVMNVQGPYPQNANAYYANSPVGQTPSSSGSQPSFNSGSPVQNYPNGPHMAYLPRNSANFQSQAQRGNNQPTYPPSSASAYPPSSTSSHPPSSASSAINPMQHLARHPLSRGGPSTSGSVSHDQYPVRQNVSTEYAVGPSNPRTQGAPTHQHAAAYQHVSVPINASTLSPAENSGTKSGIQISRPESRSNTSYTLAGALGEQSASNGPKTVENSSDILVPPEKDFWALTSGDSKAPSTNISRQPVPLSLPVYASRPSASSTDTVRTSTPMTQRAATPNSTTANANSAATSIAQPQIPSGVNFAPFTNAAQTEHAAKMFENLLGNDVRATVLDDSLETGKAPNTINNSKGRPTTPVFEALQKSQSLLQLWNNFNAARNKHSNPPVGGTSGGISNSDAPGISATASTAAPHPSGQLSIAGNSQSAYSNSNPMPHYDSYSSAPEPNGGALGESSSSVLGAREPEEIKVHNPPAQNYTPPPDSNRSSIPVTPASANQKTLARDILRALNWSSKKRKASTPPSSSGAEDMEPATKKQAIEPLSVDPPPTETSLFALPSLFTTLVLPPPSSEVIGTATIEEVQTATIQEVDDNTVVDDQIIEVSSPIPSSGGEDIPPTSVSDASNILEPSGPSPATSEAEIFALRPEIQRVDTALRPFDEDFSNPLFLPEPDSPKGTSAASESREIKGKTAQSLATGLKGRNTPFYIEVPVLTTAQRGKFLKGKTATDSTDIQMDEPSRIRFVSVGGSGKEKSAHADVKFTKEERWKAYDDTNRRLQARPCLWNDCQFVGNCGKSLRVHVRDHQRLLWRQTRWKMERPIIPCWWDGCLEKFKKALSITEHLWVHISRVNPCIHQGCNEEFPDIEGLYNHIEINHANSNNFLPYFDPFIPPQRNLPPLRTMPAYDVIHLPVTSARMSKEDRARIGPWVARNCFGPVSINVPKLNARNQVTRQNDNQVLGSWHDKYDFADRYGIKYPSRCSDLESSKATEDIEAGLFLAPDIAGPRGPLREQLFTSLADRVRVKDHEKYAVRVELLYSEEPEAEAGRSEIKVEEAQLDLAPAPPSSASQEPHPPVERGFNDFLGVGESQTSAPEGSA